MSDIGGTMPMGNIGGIASAGNTNPRALNWLVLPPAYLPPCPGGCATNNIAEGRVM